MYQVPTQDLDVKHLPSNHGQFLRDASLDVISSNFPSIEFVTHYELPLIDDLQNCMFIQPAGDFKYPLWILHIQTGQVQVGNAVL